MKKILNIFGITVCLTSIHQSPAQPTSNHLILGLIKADSNFNDQTVLDQNTAQKFLGYVKEYYGKLAKLSDDKVNKTGNSIGTRADAQHKERVIINGMRYGMFVTLNNQVHKSYFYFKCTDINGDNPIDGLIYEYHHNTQTGYISDFNYPTKHHRGPGISKAAMMQKFETYIGLANEIIAKQ